MSPSILALALLAPQSADVKAVRHAVELYLDAFYLSRPANIREAVHPRVRKFGFWKSEASWGEPRDIGFEDLVQLCDPQNPRRLRPKIAAKQVTVFEVVDRVATARSRASWGTDYLHLAKVDGKWLIVNIAWQGPEPGVK